MNDSIDSNSIPTGRNLFDENPQICDKDVEIVWIEVVWIEVVGIVVVGIEVVGIVVVGIVVVGIVVVGIVVVGIEFVWVEIELLIDRLRNYCQTNIFRFQICSSCRHSL